MKNPNQNDETHSEAEARMIRDKALKKALRTPPRPHDDSSGKAQKSRKK
tara:strand:- start:5 stop:151 length:147 start_codon:yes stop_codon:yes gene_type:complete